LVLVPFSSDL